MREGKRDFCTVSKCKMRVDTGKLRKDLAKEFIRVKLRIYDYAKRGRGRRKEIKHERD